MKSILFFCLLLATTREDYKEYFNKGLIAYNNEDYSTAVDNFSKSYTIKQHSKTSYYIAICYFKLSKDSLAQKFAHRAQVEEPSLPDNPYQQNIEHIYKFCQLAPRFRKVKIKIEQSDDRLTDAQKEEQKQTEQELRIYYPNTPEGQRNLINDLMFVQNRSLPNETELQFNTTTFKLYRNPIIDSLK